MFSHCYSGQNAKNVSKCFKPLPLKRGLSVLVMGTKQPMRIRETVRKINIPLYHLYKVSELAALGCGTF